MFARFRSQRAAAAAAAKAAAEAAAKKKAEEEERKRQAAAAAAARWRAGIAAAKAAAAAAAKKKAEEEAAKKKAAVAAGARWRARMAAAKKKAEEEAAKKKAEEAAKATAILRFMPRGFKPPLALQPAVAAPVRSVAALEQRKKEVMMWAQKRRLEDEAAKKKIVQAYSAEMNKNERRWNSVAPNGRGAMAPLVEKEKTAVKKIWVAKLNSADAAAQKRRSEEMEAMKKIEAEIVVTKKKVEKEARERRAVADKKTDKEERKRRADRRAAEDRAAEERAKKEARERRAGKKRAEKEARKRRAVKKKAEKEARERREAEERAAKEAARKQQAAALLAVKNEAIARSEAQTLSLKNTIMQAISMEAEATKKAREALDVATKIKFQQIAEKSKQLAIKRNAERKKLLEQIEKNKLESEQLRKETRDEFMVEIGKIKKWQDVHTKMPVNFMINFLPTNV
jgi:hypothetical protein